MTLSLSAFALFQGMTPSRLAADKLRYAKRGDVQADATYFRAKAATITKPADFIKDYRLLKYALTAYGMESQLQYPARIKTILLDDPNKPTALVNKMSDASYRTINSAFNFAAGGVAKLKDAAFIDSIIQKHNEASYELSLGDANPSISNALYFQRTIGTIKNGYQIIGDPALFDVVKTAFNIPNAAAAGNVASLKTWVEKSFPMSKVSDAAFVKKVIDRYLVLKDVQAQQTDGSNPMLGIFA
jgi:Protein of unknown function (DUF1217)